MATSVSVPLHVQVNPALTLLDSREWWHNWCHPEPRHREEDLHHLCPPWNTEQVIQFVQTETETRASSPERLTLPAASWLLQNAMTIRSRQCPW